MNMRILLCVCVLTFTAAALGRAAVGVITGDAVWDMKSSPVHVTGNVIIPAGASLKIEPGVTVLFDGFFHISVQGVLEAIGTQGKPVTFSMEQLNGGRRYWKGIIISGEQAKAVLSDCVVEYAFKNLCWKASPVIRSSKFSNNTYGFYCSNSKAATIIKSTFTNNTYGIYCDFSSPTIQGNIVKNNSYGIYCIFSSAPLIGQNTIEQNSEKDIFLDESMGKNEVTARNQHIWSLMRSFF